MRRTAEGTHRKTLSISQSYASCHTSLQVARDKADQDQPASVRVARRRCIKGFGPVVGAIS